jgi:hypothetical protein
MCIVTYFDASRYSRVSSGRYAALMADECRSLLYLLCTLALSMETSTVYCIDCRSVQLYEDKPFTNIMGMCYNIRVSIDKNLRGGSYHPCIQY